MRIRYLAREGEEYTLLSTHGLVLPSLPPALLKLRELWNEAAHGLCW
jgi:hypothetical protein